MVDTSLFLGFIILLLVIAIPVGLAYIADWYTEKAKQSYKKFQNANKNLPEIGERIDTEGRKWPVYARPVLFTSIDKEVQETFAKARQAFIEADVIASNFPEPPLRPIEPFQILSSQRSARCIKLCSFLIEQEVEFSAWEQELENNIKQFKEHYKKENRVLERVEKQLEKLKERLFADSGEIIHWFRFLSSTL